MMHDFLTNHREELIARCAAKVALREQRNATREQLQNGIPMFLEQLTRTLAAEQFGESGNSLKISGASGGDASVLSEIGVSAVAHGKALLKLGYTVDQVVHDYGDLCQSITSLAFELDAPFTVDEFRTLNRCLDNAIADAVTEFSYQRESAMALQHSADLNERLGFVMHELRNSLSAATLAVSALELGNLALTGATGSVLKRSHTAMARLIDRSLAEVRMEGEEPEDSPVFPLALFIAEASDAARLEAETRGVSFKVSEVDPSLGLRGSRDLLLAALINLLTNAFKFTRRHTEVSLSSYGMADRIMIEVADHCGGLPAGNTEKMFAPFSQRGADKTGLGLGLSIARRSIEADGGTLTVKDVPGTGCIFSMNLPRQTMQ